MGNTDKERDRTLCRLSFDMLPESLKHYELPNAQSLQKKNKNLIDEKPTPAEVQVYKAPSAVPIGRGPLRALKQCS